MCDVKKYVIGGRRVEKLKERKNEKESVKKVFVE